MVFYDGVEVKNGYSPLVANHKKLHHVDTDSDGLNDLLEIAFTTDLTKKDTDSDGVTDYDEVMRALNPLDLKNEKNFTRRLETDLTRQQLRYVVDEKLIMTMPVSTGNPGTPTPPGNYNILYKVPVMRYRGVDYDLPGVKWNLAFRTNGYFLHSAYWHNNFGKKTNSHGCINLREKDAALLYKYIDKGTEVVVVGKTPPQRKVQI